MRIAINEKITTLKLERVMKETGSTFSIIALIYSICTNIRTQTIAIMTMATTITTVTGMDTRTAS